ncbi:MAG: maleylacetoacetate isomerase [Inquilinus sp.]|nr:maleylacetoacetate isomerase [Inquilinus sp.]
MKLYTYFRSSAAYRLRIALALKGIAYEPAFVHLRKGEQQAAAYGALNAQHLVPTLIDGEHTLIQSMAMVEYLEEKHPEPPLLPDGAAARARVRGLAQLIACEIHPLNNLRVLKYLQNALGLPEETRDDWYRHWVAEGFAPLERLLADSRETGRYCHGDTPGLADAFLVPQVYNANRVACDLTAYPTISRINEACLALPAFADSAPDRQPDAE